MTFFGPPPPREDDWVVFGRELRNLVTVTGAQISNNHVKSWASQMQRDYPLRIFETCNRGASPQVLGNYLAPKCPNLEVAEGNSLWTAEAFDAWMTPECFLKQITIEKSIDFAKFSEFLNRKGKNLVELAFSLREGVKITIGDLEILKLPKNCPSLRILCFSCNTEPGEVLDAKFFPEMKNLKEIACDRSISDLYQ
jgi:hypothetical protein